MLQRASGSSRCKPLKRANAGRATGRRGLVILFQGCVYSLEIQTVGFFSDPCYPRAAVSGTQSHEFV